MRRKWFNPDCPPKTFAAIDFETADYGRDSACSVAVVRVEGRQIVARECKLIRPPRRTFHFTHIHGISWRQVADQPTFAEIWPLFASLIEGVEFLAAHNASFDRGVLRECCFQAMMAPPEASFKCLLSRICGRVWAEEGCQVDGREPVRSFRIRESRMIFSWSVWLCC